MRTHPQPHFAAAAAAVLTATVLSAPPAAAEPNNMVLRQITNITTGTIEWPRVRLQDGNRMAFISDGDVEGPGTETALRQLYFWEEGMVMPMRVTPDDDCESHSATRPTDGVFSGSRPEVVAFVSNCNLDLDGPYDNADGNDEIFLWEISSGIFHQMTDSVAPVYNKDPFLSDSSRCFVFSSNGDYHNNGNPDYDLYDPDHPGPTDPIPSNADGSEEVFLYAKISGETVVTNEGIEYPYPYNAVFTQVSNGPAGTYARHPVVGGYWFARQCQTTAYETNYDQLPDDGIDQGGVGEQHIFTYKMPLSGIESIVAAEVFDIVEAPDTDTTPPDDGLPGFPDGWYENPHISAASPFARGPFVVFESDANVWNNESTGNDIFRYRVFHPRLTQYTNTGKDPDDFGEKGNGPAGPGNVRNPVISDGGGIIGFDSTTEHFNQKREARIGGPPPFNADGNPEVIRLKGRGKGWQITRTENCESGQVSIDDDGRRVVFRSDCDLIGVNPQLQTQVFMWSLEKAKSTILTGCSPADGSDGCCAWSRRSPGCYTDVVFGKQLKKPPRPNCAVRDKCK